MPILTAVLLSSQLALVPADSMAKLSKNSHIQLGEVEIKNWTDDLNLVDISGLTMELNEDLSLDRNMTAFIQRTEDRETMEARNGDW